MIFSFNILYPTVSRSQFKSCKYLAISSRRSFSFSVFLSRRFWAFDTLFSFMSILSNSSVTVATSSLLFDSIFSSLVWFWSSFNSFSCLSFSSNSNLAISSVVSFFFFLSPLLAVFLRAWILAYKKRSLCFQVCIKYILLHHSQFLFIT